MKRVIGLMAALALGLAMGPAAHAGIIVSDGYYDLTQAQFPAGQPAPNPWYGSPNTTFYGNASVATSSDPDEDAVLIQNKGPSAVTVSALSIGSGSYNLFSLNGVVGPVTILAGQNAIFAGVDGSDTSFYGPQVALTVNGQNITYNDPTATYSAGGVLHGSSQFGSGDETVPWTVGYTSPSATPEPGSLTLLGLGALSLVGYGWRRRQRMA
jgi:hypothetical protein